MPLLEISDLIKRYRSPDGEVLTVLDVPAFEMDAGEQVALAGGSGTGKTTLLNVIAGILRPDSGSVFVDDVDLVGLRESDRDAFRADHLGYVFQTFNLLQGYSALENVLLGMMFGPGPDEAYARSLLDELGLSDRLDYRPRQLSIGQQQRVAVARALANRPALVLADEPTGNLDRHNATEALRMLREVCERHEAALLLVSHDTVVLDQLDRVVQLDEINRAAAGAPGGRMSVPAPRRPGEPRSSAVSSPSLLGTIRGLFLIVSRSLRQHRLSSFVTVLSVALAIGLTMAVFSVSVQTRKAFTGGRVGFDAVLGARGSQLQLVLNTVFHLETSPGNIPWSLYKAIEKDPSVALAIPYAVGDNYRGYRIVGTTERLFTEFEYREGERFEVRGKGRVFKPAFQEAVIGSRVAEKLGLRVGAKFNPFHGVVYDERAKHKSEYVVVGVLEPTNSPSDKVIWIPIEGVFRMDGHVLRGDGRGYFPKSNEAIPDEYKEVSAVMLKLKNPALGWPLSQQINYQGKVATLAWPIGKVMAELFDKMGWVTKILELVAYLVMVVAAASILASIYNTMNERRREFAILRALGARRRVVFSAIVLEATTIAALGCLVGYGVYAGVLAGVAVVVREQTGVVLDLATFHDALWMTPLAMIALGAVSGLLPALKAYRTDVASNLLPAS